jgi:hypothetical protein
MSAEEWKSIFDILTTIAVGFAFICGAGALWAGRIVNKQQAERLREFDRGITDAKIELSKQEERAARAEKDLADVQNMVAGANERAARAEEGAADANRLAEQERLARIKIEERMAWRRVSPKQHQTFVEALRPYKGSIVELEKFGDLEASVFADDILRVLSDSGWNVRLSVTGQRATLYIGPGLNPMYGLRIEVNDALPAGRALASVFKELNAVSITRMSSTGQVVAHIQVGIRPPL